mgnify:CR=1 FL=1
MLGRNPALRNFEFLEIRERIDAVFGGIERRLDCSWPLRVVGDSHRLISYGLSRRSPLRCRDHFHARLERFRRVHGDHHRDRAVVEAHQVARRIDAEQLREAAHQVLIELLCRRCASCTARMRSDRERLLIGALRSHRVVDVGDAAQHGAEVEAAARHAERDSRCRRAAGDARTRSTGASAGISGVRRRISAPSTTCMRMIANSLVGQLVRLVEDLGRRPHLADVVHQRRQAELAQQRAVDAERARLRPSSGSTRSPCA